MLLIEDCEDDALLIIRELQRSGFDVDWQRVQTAKSLQQHLKTDAWDIVISDYQLPGFSVTFALEILKNTQLDIPFIVVSGAIRDGVAVQLMKAGAVDYLMKDNLTRLPETIRREIRESRIRVQHQQAIAELHSTQERLQLAIEGSGIGLWDWWIETGTITLNNRWAEMIGYSLQELEPVGLEVWQRYAHPQDWQRSMTLLEAHFQQKLPLYECELRMRHKAGHWVWVLARGRVVERDRAGRPRRITGTHLDITDRKEYEALLATRERYLTALVDIQNQLLSTKIDHKIYQNVLEILGTTVEANRIYIFENHCDESGNLLMSQRGEWCGSGIAPQINNANLQNIRIDGKKTRWFELLSHGEMINSAVVDLPLNEREILEAQGVLSVLVLPLIVDGEFWGLIGFDNYLEVKQWETIEIEFLRSAVTAISLAKEREQSAQLIARLNRDLEKRVELRTAALQESETKL
ncbi:MAG TPA: PAS domain-containing protein, partial [Coleofasciculaceae cyanobacterium]